MLFFADLLESGEARMLYHLIAEVDSEDHVTDTTAGSGFFGYIVYAQNQDGTISSHSEEASDAPVLFFGDDLTVGWIARLPRISYVWNSPEPWVDGWPARGQKVRWQAVIKNWFSDVNSVDYIWYLDGVPVDSGTVTVTGDDTAHVDYAWSWQFERHELKIVIDPHNSIYEEEEQNNFSRPRRILAAQYEGKLTGKHTAILFEDSNGQRDYYTPEGKSLKKAFLRAPLKYKYISSPFSYSRLHPILRIRRPHLGIDYAAPIGTPVVAIAEGVVTMVSYANDCGRYIKIKHLKGYESVYAHLSRYAKGIKKGVHVRQGQIIGYVGSSGLSTGPHLYFAISKNGKRINFLKMKMPSISSINPEYISQFEEIKKEYLSLLNGGEYGKTSPLNTCIGIPIQSERG